MTHKESFLKRNPTGMTPHPKLWESSPTFRYFKLFLLNNKSDFHHTGQSLILIIIAQEVGKW